MAGGRYISNGVELNFRLLSEFLPTVQSQLTCTSAHLFGAVDSTKLHSVLELMMSTLMASSTF